MNKEEFDNNLIEKLRNEDLTVFKAFEEFQESEMDEFQKIEWTHDFLDLLSFKLRESKSKMDKDFLAEYILNFFKKTIKSFEYNPKFISAQFKSLVTFYRNHRDLDKAIHALEFLIENGIADDEGQAYHLQLDDLYRLRLKRAEKENR